MVALANNAIYHPPSKVNIAAITRRLARARDIEPAMEVTDSMILSEEKLPSKAGPPMVVSDSMILSEEKPHSKAEPPLVVSDSMILSEEKLPSKGEAPLEITDSMVLHDRAIVTKIDKIHPHSDNTITTIYKAEPTTRPNGFIPEPSHLPPPERVSVVRLSNGSVFIPGGSVDMPGGKKMTFKSVLFKPRSKPAQQTLEEAMTKFYRSRLSAE